MLHLYGNIGGVNWVLECYDQRLVVYIRYSLDVPYSKSSSIVSIHCFFILVNSGTLTAHIKLLLSFSSPRAPYPKTKPRPRKWTSGARGNGSSERVTTVEL